jgi:putative ABC transport system permease protein
MRIKKLIAGGLDPESAKVEALRRFGDMQDVESACHNLRKRHYKRKYMQSVIDAAIQDIRFALRSLHKKPGFAAAAVLSVAIGIGVNVAVFTLLYTVLIAPLPFAQPERLVAVEASAPEQDIQRMAVSYPILLDWQEQNRSFVGVAGFWYTNYTFTGHGRPERIRGTQVTANITEVLGVEPILGRTFRPDEEGPGVSNVVLIGEGLWRRRFGSDPEVVGQVITLGGQQFTIIGVMPAHFRFPEASDLWAPFPWDATFPRFARFINVVGRLRPDQSMERALADMNILAGRLGEEYPDTDGGIGVRLTGLRQWIFGDETEPILIFYGIVCLVLLLACANVANLTLARNATRNQEVAIRTSLGASRGRMTRQFFTESLLLAVIGGAAGIAIGVYGRQLILALAPVNMPYLAFEIRPVVVVMISAIVIASGLLFGLAPAITSVQTDPAGTLQSLSGRLTDGLQKASFRSFLVTCEIAIALAVLIGSNLMVKSALRQRAVDPGFTTENLATVFVTPPDANYPGPEEITDFYDRLLATVVAMPGITDASIATELPKGSIDRSIPIYVEGTALPNTAQFPSYPTQNIEAGYFATTGIPLLRGRDFTNRDFRGAQPVVIVNESFAHPGVYLPARQLPSWDVFLVARTVADPRSVMANLREAIWSIDPDLPLSEFRTMEEVLLETNWQIRIYSWVLGFFSVIALLLASTGIYGVMAYTVARRSREFAIRVAVGADPRTVLAMVIRQGGALCAVGLLVGVALATIGMQFFATLLFDVSPSDIAVYGISLGAMMAIGLAATYVPARRAIRMTPMDVLGQE